MGWKAVSFASLLLVFNLCHVTSFDPSYTNVISLSGASVSASGSATASLAVTDGSLASCYTSPNQTSPWLRIALNDHLFVDMIRIYSNTPLVNIEVTISASLDEDTEVLCDVSGNTTTSVANPLSSPLLASASASSSVASNIQPIVLWCGNASASFVTLRQYGQHQSMSVCEVEVFGSLVHDEVNDVSVDVTGVAVVAGEWPGSGWIEKVTSQDEPNPPLSFFKSSAWVMLQGCVAGGVSGATYPITRLPKGTRPVHEHTFVCATTADEAFPASVMPVPVTVKRSGLIVVDAPTVAPSVCLDGVYFSFHQSSLMPNGTHSTFHSISNRVQPGFRPLDTSIYGDVGMIEDSNGIMHLEGAIIATENCTGPQCVLLQLDADVLPHSWIASESTSLFAQPLSSRRSNGGILALDVLSDGRVVVDEIQAGEAVWLMAVMLLPPLVSGSGTEVVVLDVHYPWLHAHSPPRVVMDTSGRVYLGGTIYFEQTSLSFRDMPIATLSSPYAPMYVSRHVVGCGVQGLRQVCTVSVWPSGDVVPDAAVTQQSKLNWLSLDGISYGGFDVQAEVQITGDATVTLSNSAYITFHS